MPKYTIEIDGLPEGYEPAEKGFYSEKLKSITISLHPKIRKYDWSKTLDDVLVEIENKTGLYPLKLGRVFGSSNKVTHLVWQPNIHGKCPVDPKASIVRVRKCGDSHVYEEGLAGSFNWSFLPMAGEVIASWQFIRLADNAEW